MTVNQEIVDEVNANNNMTEDKCVYTYEDGFEDGMNEKASDVLEMLTSFLTDASLDANTINVIIEKVNNL